MAKLVLGPVIGEVTSTTARVGVEVNTSISLSMQLSGEDGSVHEKSLNLPANRFKALLFENLSPDVRYSVGIEGAKGIVKGQIKTKPEEFRAANFAAVSCNFTVRRKTTDAWADLRDRFVLPGKIDVLFHVGDQIYGDSAFQKAEILLQARKIGTKVQQEKIKEYYRSLYRMSWAFPSTRDVLANVSNLMIWDDHEIRDDWGSEKADSDEESQAYHIGTLAHEVFREYQRQLWQAPESWPDKKLEHHLHKWGDIGVLFVDQRGGRSFERDNERPYLGTLQWQGISKSLSANGYFHNVRALVVVTSVPLVYLGDTITNGGTGLVDDLKDHWAYGTHRTEQIELLRLLRRWKEQAGREVLVVGGDVHIGLKSDIRHQGKRVIRQLITSPVTNNPPGGIMFGALKTLLELEQTIGDNYQVEHHGYSNKRNYGLIMVRVPSNASDCPSITSGIETPS